MAVKEDLELIRLDSYDLLEKLKEEIESDSIIEDNTKALKCIELLSYRIFTKVATEFDNFERYTDDKIRALELWGEDFTKDDYLYLNRYYITPLKRAWSDFIW